MGCHVNLIFLELPDVETAISRAAEIVRHGGHDIPENTIRRRFETGLENLHHSYKPIVDVWLHFDNAGEKYLSRYF